MRELARPVPAATPNDGHVVALVLTKSQWDELLMAVESKRVRVQRGDYGEAPDSIDAEKWADDLEKLYKSIHQALEDQGVA
jgi:hypothetical protein